MSMNLTPEQLINPHFDIPNEHKFRMDLKDLAINKICMTEVVNADLVIASNREADYFAACKETLDEINKALIEWELKDNIHIYSYNYKTFILAANDNLSTDEFLKISTAFHEGFEVASSQSTSLVGITRFAVVLKGDFLIERALSCLYVNRDSQDTFFIAEEELSYQHEIENEAKIVNKLHWAIDNDGIIPFYQGIRNNLTGKIDKYEALMRFKDVDGKIYPPGMFLDIAHKFNLYNRLSILLIEKALNDFENRDENLSLNISLSDIQSKSFREWIINRIANYKQAQKVVIEFVETENYTTDLDMLSFVKTMRNLGCKISIDDFGSGFSTYTAVIAMSPEYIKIDGGIIKDIATKKDNLIILHSICFMADLIGAEIIAEFVENEDIQKVLLEYDVPYSQGYLFSKPDAIENLPKEITQNT